MLKLAAATPAVIGLGVGMNVSACGDQKSPPPSDPLFEVGLYSWDEIQTLKTQTQRMGTAILRLAGPLTDAQWKAVLAEKGAEPLAFEITRHEATERAYTGKLEGNTA